MAELPLPPRVAGDDWNRGLYLPAPGYLPPAEDVVPERVLHIALRSPRDPQDGLRRALIKLSATTGYTEIDWHGVVERFGANELRFEILRAAKALRPTLVFMQLQEPSLSASFLQNDLRPLCEAFAVIVNWDGDRFHAADHPSREWFHRLGRVVDLSLVTNTTDPPVYAKLGMKSVGYLQIGLNDEQRFRPGPDLPIRSALDEKLRTPDPAAFRGDLAHVGEKPPQVVFLGCGNEQSYPARTALVRRLAARLLDPAAPPPVSGRPRFAVYGDGWDSAIDPWAKPRLDLEAEAAMYRACKVAISISIRSDVAHYTSDRLLRACACGAQVVVEDFPGRASMGFVDGASVLAFKPGDEAHFDYQVRAPKRWGTGKHGVPAGSPESLRRCAARVVHEAHTWDVRMRELAAMVRAARERRSS